MRAVVRYERQAGLNVRSEPRADAEIVRVMRTGDADECVSVSGEWYELSDGYALGRFLSVTLEDDGAPGCGGLAEPARQPLGERPDPADGDGGELARMSNAQLHDLAEKSGVKVRKGATKKELIDAILADE